MRDLVAVFDEIRLPMMAAERTVRSLLERSMDSTGSSPRNFLISRGVRSNLRARAKRTRQGVLTVKTSSEAAYLTLVSVLLTLSASAMYIPSSGPTKFPSKLQTRIDQTRQGVLTVGKSERLEWQRT